MMENWQRAGFGLYVHWPFCAAKCPYCDFNSHVQHFVEQDRWRRALLNELNYWADRTEGRVLSSIFFGGGTPSMMPPETVAEIIERAKERWTPANDLEVTLEANPTSSDAARFQGYVDGGVNRISVGLQALRDDDLRRLGRLHTAKEGRRAFDIAQAACRRVSFDLIYARQDQDPSAWRKELTEALSFAGEHMSLYQLTVEPETAFGARHRAGKLPGLPGEDRSVDLWQITQELCEAAGRPRYETSNHAKPGAEAVHNMIYWQGGDWVGIGPGAHGRLELADGRVATEALKTPGQWITAVEAKSVGVTSIERLQDTDIKDEYVMMSLRTTEGMSLSRFCEFGGQIDQNLMQSLEEEGLLTCGDDRLRTTERGALLLNAILSELLVA